MIVPSIPFLLFGIAGAVVFNLLPRSIVWGRLVLLATNLSFFCTFLHGPASAAPYIAFLALGYASVLILRRRSAPYLFPLLLGLVLFCFFDLKRYAFIPSALTPTWPYTAVGLSYVFFRVLHLVIEAHQRSLEEDPSLLSYVNYTLNFTALVSGPIQLYPDYRRTEVEARAPMDLFAVAWGAERIVIGLFKVLFVSTLLNKLHHAGIDRLSLGGSVFERALDCMLILSVYPLFLYANFSGYTDFVIGIARLYRLILSENFNRPFASENFIAFWSRWHITLSSWLKTYVYMPLLMTLMRRSSSVRVEPYLGVAAYFVTFFLVGAWHGQTSMFLVFGLLQGGGVAANKLYQVQMTLWLSRKGYRNLCTRPIYRGLCRGLTFTWFAFTMLWFWSSWSQLGEMIHSAGWQVILASMAAVFTLATLTLTLIYVRPAPLEAHVPSYDPEPSPDRYWRTVAATAMVVCILALNLVLNSPVPDIVYKGF